MTNEAMVVETEEVVKPKRTRKAKVEKTAIQIMEEVAALQTEVVELETALGELDDSSVFYPVAKEIYETKTTELENALHTKYTI